MKAKIEFNSDLALYSPDRANRGDHLPDECLPVQLEPEHSYRFRKIGHRNYAIGSTVTLREIRDDEVFLPDRAQVEIVESFFDIEDGSSYTKGEYRVHQLLRD